MTRHKNNPWDKPWVTIAAVVGVIAVVIIALVFFLGSGNSSGGVPSAQTTTGPSGSSTQQAQAVTIKPTTQVTIPVTGVYVKVSYLGSFNGTYGMTGAIQSVKNSGDRVYEIVNATGNVTATFYKQDRSTTHDITVELWKNGKSLTSAKNSSAFGKVSIMYKV